MNTQEILTEFVEVELLGGRGRPDADDDLLTSDLVDSLGVMRLLVFLEEAFDIQVPPEEVTIENFQSIAAISQFLKRKQA